MVEVRHILPEITKKGDAKAMTGVNKVMFGFVSEVKEEETMVADRLK